MRHHRRRFLNVVTRNWSTATYSLHRIDLHSSENNLFYPTAAAAAAAQDPGALFGGGARRHVALDEVPEIRLPAAEQRFLQRHALSRSPYEVCLLHCVALSESETVFLDHHSQGAFLYDADERCVVTLPYLRGSKQAPVCLSVTGAGNEFCRDETIYVMDRLRTMPAAAPAPRDIIRLQALVHSKWYNRSYSRDTWRRDELPPPPYVANGDDWSTKIGAHALVGASAGDVICVSTFGAGTYCFDTATRTWSKAGDWALDFAGEVVHDVDLGVWVGFMHYLRKDEVQRLCATADLLSAADRRRVTLCRDAPPGGVGGVGCKDLEPPHGWYQDRLFQPKLVSLGSGKFCVVQFFEIREEDRSELGQMYDEIVDRIAESTGEDREEVCAMYGKNELVVDKFALFTGIEVVRCAAGGNGGAAGGGGGAGELRMIVHKSRRHMLTNSDADIVFVL